jgi:hypothetical protein
LLNSCSNLVHWIARLCASFDVLLVLDYVSANCILHRILISNINWEHESHVMHKGLSDIYLEP